MSNGKRWTLHMCGNCDRPRNISPDEGGCPDLAGCLASLHRGEDAYLPMLPVSTLESLAQELERRAGAATLYERKHAFKTAAQLVRAEIEEGGDGA